jgi:aspartate racemase
MMPVGLVGGIGWPSAADYYRRINERAAELLGPGHAAHLVLYSVPFHEIVQRQHAGDRAGERALLLGAVRGLERAGCTMFALACVTAHRDLAWLLEQSALPAVGVGDAVARACAGYARVGVLGSRATLDGEVLAAPLRAAGIEPLVPSEPSRDRLQQIIERLAVGAGGPADRQELGELGAELTGAGAEALVLGCTELPGAFAGMPRTSPLIDVVEAHTAAIADAAFPATRPLNR